MQVPKRPGLGFTLSDQARAWTTDTVEFGHQ
jgi:L-talarate/galactarate dehydratase